MIIKVVLLVSCLLLARPLHSLPHVSVWVTGDHILVTTFATTGHGPDKFHTWTIDGDSLMILRPCGRAIWIGKPGPGDFDADGDVDLRDMAIMYPMMTGPGESSH